MFPQNTNLLFLKRHRNGTLNVNEEGTPRERRRPRLIDVNTIDSSHYTRQ